MDEQSQVGVGSQVHCSGKSLSTSYPVSQAWRVVLGGLPIAHLYCQVPGLMSQRERGCHRSWQCWGFEDGGHLASVAGEFQVPGVGSQPLTVLERGAGLSNTFSLLPSREVEGLAIRGISKTLSLQLKGRNQGQRDQSEGQPWLKCPCPRPSHIFCGPPAGLDGLRIWGVRDRVCKRKEKQSEGGFLHLSSPPQPHTLRP